MIHTRDAREAEDGERPDSDQALNPDVKVVPFPERLTRTTSLRISTASIVVDGGDNFPTRYLLNDACVRSRQPDRARERSIASRARQRRSSPVRARATAACIRQPPPPELAPSCAEAGVLGVLPGIIGLVQANEVLKLLLGVGAPLIGRLLTFDALGTRFSEL